MFWNAKRAFPFLIADPFRPDHSEDEAHRFAANKPFPHIVIDNFLPQAHAAFLSKKFPASEHPVWLDWRKRSPHQYGKQGPGDASKFATLEPEFRLALQEFNTAPFLNYLERVTGVAKLLPDPYFSGGGMHQIVEGGILDIHTDFNRYNRLDLKRRLNVLIYLNENWKPEYGGALELWDKRPADGGRAIEIVPPLFNRAVIFKTDKKSFHGHPAPWNGPEGVCRRSIALYYYTVAEEAGHDYTEHTDFQSVAVKDLP